MSQSFRRTLSCLPILLSLFVTKTRVTAFSPAAFRSMRDTVSSTITFGAASEESMPSSESSKNIVFIRHGRTYMNDFINGIHYGGPGFSDIFDTPENKSKYHDSPLGPTGLEQADALFERLGDLIGGKEGAEEALSLGKSHTNFLDELDLVVVSPLTRALQTMEIGLYPHIKSRNIPIVAVPQASERLYMVSDIGKSRSELERAYEYVDFESGFDPTMKKDDLWHWIPTEEESTNYNEWRPHGEGQNYAHLGEIEERFDARMNELHGWLHSREEKMIAVVCHYGVIDWMLQEGFENCELRVVPFEQLKPRALAAVNEFKTQPVPR